jgi:hypothetical protein
MLKSAFIAQTYSDEWWNPAKLSKKKAPEQGGEKETKCEDRAKEPPRVSPTEEKEPLSTKTSTGGMKHIN